MTSHDVGERVRVAVCGPGGLFDDLLVSALRARGQDAFASREPDLVTEVDVAVLSDEGAGHRGPAGASRALLLVADDTRAARRTARALGATGCLAVTAGLDELAEAVLRVARDEGPLAHPAVRSERSLTSREIDVLHLMAAGHDNATIASTLEISPHTARTHVQRILTKFDVRNRFLAVSVARGQGLLRSGT
jgi:DNA-binding CsgD family transcriptional regulator